MTALPPDYDSDPERWHSRDPAWQVFGDVHDEVAERIAAERLAPVLDVGGGDGRLASLLPPGWPVATLDSSPTQLGRATGRRVMADAMVLPAPTSRIGAVTMLWMLYHLEDPMGAVTEAHRVLRPGGLLVTCTASRRNDPELTDGYPRSTFDAEEAEAVVGAVFSDLAVVGWDAPMTYLPDGEAVLRYCRSHHLPARAADRVSPPVWLTKRGCLIYARR